MVANAGGSVTSKPAALQVLLPPTIGAQPESLTVPPFQSASLHVAALGTAPLSYQWRHNGQPLNDNYAYTTNYVLPQAQGVFLSIGEPPTFV